MGLAFTLCLESENVSFESPIPVMDDPLGRYWEQPSRDDILVDDVYALMSKESFDKLHNYECSHPTGAYPGKMWRRDNILFWWVTSSKDSMYCVGLSREIIIL